MVTNNLPLSVMRHCTSTHFTAFQVFLSQEVAISILQDFKLAYIRCKNLVSSKDLAARSTDIYNILVQYLCSEFIDYAIGEHCCLSILLLTVVCPTVAW